MRRYLSIMVLYELHICLSKCIDWASSAVEGTVSTEYLGLRSGIPVRAAARYNNAGLGLINIHAIYA